MTPNCKCYIKGCVLSIIVSYTFHDSFVSTLVSPTDFFGQLGFQQDFHSGYTVDCSKMI
jgi:hypothetical protein